ncbi:hypothetical protein Kpho02_66230 [Kitasatospora phosalacinea]|uniref:Uncharacterized protein n=1 Tax=Kitasatospora phosalacinea TaxID=2065 RepID=A0A9W6QC06_9ACTN|nr:hypothetical protein Kpho02_66230 [Kitasatospora phosalacinea]
MIGQAASHTHRSGTSAPAPARLVTVFPVLSPVPDMGVPPDLPVGSRQYESSRT